MTETDKQMAKAAWALWNDCNGVFTETVKIERAEAEDFLAANPHYAAADAEIVRVYIVADINERR